MPLYDYPDVPSAPGVPDVNRSAAVSPEEDGDLNVAADGDSPEAYQDDANGAWSILDADGNPVVVPDSVVSFEYRNDQRIATHPVEDGSFSSYNKVATPYDARIRMTCGGQGQMTRDQFLAQMQSMVDSIDLYTIVTPDQVYDSVNLDHYDYRRESRNGVTLLTVDAWFSEVRATALKTYTNTQDPSGAAVTDNGTVQPSQPSPEVQTAMAEAGVA